MEEGPLLPSPAPPAPPPPLVLPPVPVPVIKPYPGRLLPAAASCSGHGKLVGDRCECDQPWPEEGKQGWTGPQCGIPVWAAAAADVKSGADLTSWCRGQQCHSLPAGGWACFAVRAPFQ